MAPHPPRSLLTMPHNSRGVMQHLTVLLAATFVLAVALPAQVAQGPTTIRSSVHNDLSQPLSVMAQHAAPLDPTLREAEPVMRVPLPPGLKQLSVDPIGQMMAPQGVLSPAVGLSFEGLGQGQYGYSVNVAPPDTNGAVGATQYVQWVN